MLKTPVFRRSIRTASGWAMSKTEPMKYSTYAFYLDRIGTDLGSEEKWTSYCFWHGHANAQVTGCPQNAYQNSREGFNTDDAFLERDPSADDPTRAFTHVSIKCNPEVPKQIPKAELAKLPPDPEVVRLAKQVEAMARRIGKTTDSSRLPPRRSGKSINSCGMTSEALKRLFGMA